MTRKCPTCGGDGIVVSDATNALQVERRLRALAASGAGSRVQAYRVALHPRTLALVAGPGGARLAALEEPTRRRFFLVPPRAHVHADHFEVARRGSAGRPRADGAGRGRRGARAQARRGRPARRRRGGREGRRDRRRRRRRGEARRQEGEGRGRSRPRRPGVRDARRRRHGRGADHVRERGREADPRPRAAEDRRGGAEAEAAVEEVEPCRDEATTRLEVGRRGRAVSEAGSDAGLRRASGRGAAPAAASAGRSRHAAARRSRAGRRREVASQRPRQRPSRRPRRSRSSRGEAEAEAAPQAGSGRRDPRARRRRRGGRSARSDGEPVAEPAERGSVGDRRRSRRAARRSRRGRRRAGAEEAHAARHAWRPQPEGKPAAANGDGAAGERRRRPSDAPEEARCVRAVVPAPRSPTPGRAGRRDPPEGGYVPMSEWIEDFDRR